MFTGRVLLASAIAVLPAVPAYAGIGTLNSGDKATITGTLSTSDPNENGEGEPVIITANGAVIGTISGYAVPTTFQYTASGPTTLDYSIAGADGDESAAFTLAVNASTSLLTPAQKQAFAAAAAATATVSGTFWTIDAICGTATAGICALAGTPVAALSSLTSGVLALAAADPADPNFKVVALPDIATLAPTFGPAQGIAQDEANIIGFGNALITSVNRYQGAFDAGNSFWIGQQATAVGQYDREFLTAISQLSTDLHTLGLSFMSYNLTSSDAYNAEAALAYGSLPQSDINFLESTFGLTQSDINLITERIYVQNINAISGNVGNDFELASASISPRAVPEPATWAMMLLGFAGIGFALRKRRATVPQPA